MNHILNQKPRRIQVVGSSCAGKSTFAKSLSQVLNIPHVELDALHWEPNWVEADTEVFKSRVSKVIDREEWIVDGQYTGKIGNLVTREINTIIWLDMSLPVILTRFFLRTFKRAWTREVLWNGCQETLRNSIFKRNSLLMWILSTHRARKAKYLSLLNNLPAGQTMVRLQSPRQVKSFLNSTDR